MAEFFFQAQKNSKLRNQNENKEGDKFKLNFEANEETREKTERTTKKSDLNGAFIICRLMVFR